MPLLSVVVPTFNEAANIRALLRDLQAALAGIDTEIVVVDDNSKDGTPQEARAACPEAKVIVRTDERGLATAVVRGIRESTGTYVAVMDADFQHPPEAVRRLLQRAEETGADLVVGSRYAPGGGIGDFTRSRQLMSHGAAWLSRMVLPPLRRGRVTDPMSGLFLVRRERVPLSALRPRGYKILLEVIGRSPLRRIEEVGYIFQDRRGGQSKLGSAVVGQYVAHLALLAKDHPDNRRLARFVVVGLSGVLVQLGAFYLLLRALGAPRLLDLRPWMQIAVPAVATEVAIASNFLLNDNWTFRDRRSAPLGQRFLLFQGVSLLGWLINNGTLYLLDTRFHLLSDLPAQLVAIALAFVANFAGNLAFTYRRPAHG